MFQTMVTELNTFRADAFKDEAFKPLTEEQFQEFLKESTFKVLQGNHLGKLFQEKFGIQDRVLSIFSDDQNVIKHIRYCKYVK